MKWWIMKVKLNDQGGMELTTWQFIQLCLVKLLALYIGLILGYWIAIGDESLFDIIKDHWEHVSSLRIF